MNKPIKILQITDLHLFGDQKSKLLGLNPYNHFKKVIKSIADNFATMRPDLTIFSGDLSQDYSLQSYLTVKECCKIFDTKVTFIPGNHDDQAMLHKILNSLHDKEFDFPNWRILLLNSAQAGQVTGFLTAKELDFLEKTLAKNPTKATLIFMHHHTLPINCHWLDKLGLTNADAFLNIISKYQNTQNENRFSRIAQVASSLGSVLDTHDSNKRRDRKIDMDAIISNGEGYIKAVVCGHIHQESNQRYLGVDFLSTPATCWQFLPQSPKFKLDSAMPGYRWFELYSDGTYKTYVKRLEYDEKMVPDLNSGGY
ncbi:MAG: hypothetical protein A2X78_03955 [Gammaproteobacteria bacterium GWE2_37_16]|nr:MAG: hypothetical protein A2X78_03955 [Gammaproteobacteria bacterium GWE2_37_16]